MDIINQAVSGQMACTHTLELHPDLKPHIMHVHTHLELLYFLGGKAEWRVEGSVYPLEVGDILIMRPAEAHALVLNPNIPYERICIHFEEETLLGGLNQHLLQPFYDRPLGQSNYIHHAQLPQEYIKSCFNRLFSRKENSKNRIISFLVPILQEIYDVWKNNHQQGQQQYQTSLPVQLINYVNTNLFRISSLKQLESHFYMHQSQINRIFRNYTNSSVWQYILTKRLFAARELMQAGTPPGIASNECGYQDYSAFYRAYKKQFGHSPQADYNADAKTAPRS